MLGIVTLTKYPRQEYCTPIKLIIEMKNLNIFSDMFNFLQYELLIFVI